MDACSIRKMLLDGKFENVLIASHRGKFGSSVMENTVLAFTVAIGQGADMVEMDLAKTKDGIFIGHHDDDMSRLFHKAGKIQDYTYSEIKQMPIYNVINEPCVEHVSTLDEILSALKEKTILVLDKCWEHWEDIAPTIKTYNMAEQVVLKFYIEDAAAASWALQHQEFMYIPMVQNPNDKEKVYSLKQETTIVGIEILPEDPDSLFLTSGYIKDLHAHGLAVWCNSLNLSSELVYGGGFDDLKSLRNGGSYGWGELITRGIDIIQTDWVYELFSFRKSY